MTASEPPKLFQAGSLMVHVRTDVLQFTCGVPIAKLEILALGPNIIG